MALSMHIQMYTIAYGKTIYSEANPARGSFKLIQESIRFAQHFSATIRALCCLLNNSSCYDLPKKIYHASAKLAICEKGLEREMLL